MTELPSNPSLVVSDQAEKLFKDSWNSNPPQVTSYLTYPRTALIGHSVTYTSPNCGLGWRFQIREIHEQVAISNVHVQDSARRVDVTFQPHMCSSMPWSAVGVDVKVSYPSANSCSAHVQAFAGVSLKSNQHIGSYRAPPLYEGQVHIEITLTFSDSDGLSFPTTSPPNAAAALQQSLDASSFVDSKFYLFSAKAEGRPTRPRAVYAKSTLLTDRSAYLRDLFSTSFSETNSTPCDLREDVPEEIDKLDANDFDYEDDSDLEDEEEEESNKATTSKETGPTIRKGRSSPTITIDGQLSSKQQDKLPDRFQDGRAFAVNGTAFKTWKAFIYYAYTNEIYFDKLRSQRTQASPDANSVSGPSAVACSPKSMYRFADSANIPHLKSMAKTGIQQGLSQRNIITELFSVFTSRFQEIIELEVDFLLNNFTGDVADKFDDMLQSIVSGGATHCFRVLAFTLRRLRGASSDTAWAALRRCAPEAVRLQNTRVIGPSEFTTSATATQLGAKDAIAEEAEQKKEAEEAKKERVRQEQEHGTGGMEAEEARLMEEGQKKEMEEEEAKAATTALNKQPAKRKKGGKKKGVLLNLWEDEEAKEKERLEQEMREAEERAAEENAEREAKEKAEKEARVSQKEMVGEGAEQRAATNPPLSDDLSNIAGFTTEKPQPLRKDPKTIHVTGQPSTKSNFLWSFVSSSSELGGGSLLSAPASDTSTASCLPPLPPLLDNTPPRVPSEAPTRASLRVPSPVPTHTSSVKVVTESTAEKAAEPSLDLPTAEGSLAPSPTSSVYSSDIDVPLGIKERNKQAIIIRAQIHELTKRLEYLEQEEMNAQAGDGPGLLGGDYTPREQEMTELDSNLEMLKMKAQRLYQAAVKSTNQYHYIQKINLEKTSPADAALRVEDVLGLKFSPEVTFICLDIDIPRGILGRPVRLAVQKVLNEYGIRSTFKVWGFKIQIYWPEYSSLITKLRQSHSQADDSRRIVHI